MNQNELIALAKARIKLKAKATKLDDAATAAKKDLAAHDALLRAELVGAKLDSIRAAGFNFTPSERTVYNTLDWDAYWAWARKDKLGVYVQKRPSTTAIAEQLAAGKEVPGIELVTLPSLSVTRAA